MVWLILALLLGVVLASIVVGLVAVPARREGRSVLTEHGESMVSGLTERTDKVTDKVGRGASGLVSSVKRRRTEASEADRTDQAGQTDESNEKSADTTRGVEAEALQAASADRSGSVDSARSVDKAS